MSSHVFHDLHVHLVWHVKSGRRLLTGEVEELTHAFLRSKARMNGVYLHQLGGTDDHVHLAFQIEPFVTIAQLVEELKEASAFEVNKRLSRQALDWERGYGAVSFARRNLEWMVSYIENQRGHHESGRLVPRLEAHGEIDLQESDLPGL
jgi:REP element-mobilizing transposase RayT